MGSVSEARGTTKSLCSLQPSHVTCEHSAVHVALFAPMGFHRAIAIRFGERDRRLCNDHGSCTDELSEHASCQMVIML